MGKKLHYLKNFFLTKDNFINLYEKRIKVLNLMFNVIFLVNAVNYGHFSFMLTLILLFIFILNSIYFIIKKRILESFFSVIILLVLFGLILFNLSITFHL